MTFTSIFCFIQSCFLVCFFAHFFEPQNMLPSPLPHLATSQTGPDDDAGLPQIWKTKNPIHHKLCRPHEHTRFFLGFQPQGVWTHTSNMSRMKPMEVMTASIFPPTQGCIVQILDPSRSENHCPIWYSWDSPGRKSRVQCLLFHAQGICLKKKRHLECFPAAVTNHCSQ